MSWSFVAKVEKMGSWYVLNVPKSVTRAIGKRGHVYVVAKVNGVTLRRSLIPRGGGVHCLTLSAPIRKRARIDAGDRAKVSLALDAAPPDAAIPGDLAFVLRDEDALDAFRSLSRSHKNALIKWIDQAVMAHTREKRIARALEIALAKREKAIDREAAKP